VTASILALVLANVLMLGLGVGLLPLLRLAATPRELVQRLPIAYAAGLAGTGIASAELALVGIPVGIVALPLLMLVVLALGLRRLGRGGAAEPEDTRRRPWALPALALLAVAAVFLANAARVLAVKPLLENDGWALWGLRARALYEFGHPTAPVFTDAVYPALQYPLFLPELEAIDAHFMRGFDGTLIHLQLLGLAVAFVGAAWTLLARRAPSLLAAATLLAIVTAPSFFGQLGTNSADVPLAMLIGLGVTALATWLADGGAGLLPVATLFLSAGAMTKNEGELFAGAAYVVALLVARRAQRRPLLVATGVSLALVLPWHLWLLAHGITATTFALSHLLHPHYLTSHWYRVTSAQDQLLDQIWRHASWTLLPFLAVAGAAAAVLLRRYRVAAFGIAWILVSFAGLLCVYWASPLPLHPNLFNSADRTIDTLVIGGALLVPVLLGRPGAGYEEGSTPGT
jgi:hypothetical protein